MSARSRMVQLVMLAMGCQSIGGLAGRGVGGIGGSCSGDFGATAAANTLESFVASVDAFSQSAQELDTSLKQACTRMATAMNVSVPNPDDTRAVCQRVAAQVREDMTGLRGQAGLRVEIEVVPPRCQVSVDAYAQCAGQCDASYTPGSAEIQCEGGEISGTCGGECRGSCVADVSGTCNGTCEGACNGTCSAQGANGACNGQCNGQCQGRCAVRAQANCTGECRGGCSVAYTEPRCSGRVVPPRVSAQCRASCDARLNAQASCTPARTTLRVTGNVSSDLQARATRLRAAVENGYASVLDVRAKVERVARTGEELVTNARRLPDAVGGLAANAAICAGAAVSGAASAAASVNVSVQVSVEVSGSFSARGG